MIFNKQIKITLFLCFSIFTFSVMASSDDSPLIFPYPQQLELTGETFSVNEKTEILVPTNPDEKDLFLASFLSAELSDQFGTAVLVVETDQLPESGNYFLIASQENELIKSYISKNDLQDKLDSAGKEGYILDVSQKQIVVAGFDQPGAYYGLQSLRQILKKKNDVVEAPGLLVFDKPTLPFRGIHLFLPGHENIPFFKRFLRDFMALYKYNKVVIQINSNMRLKKHPELNAGTVDFNKSLLYTRRNRPSGPNGEGTDDSHYQLADGQILEQDDVADLVEFARANFIDVIPEIPSLSHAYFLLTRHRHLAEQKDAEWPDTFCPSEPGSYELLFDVFDEYIDVMKPEMIHIGKDEWRVNFGVCDLCKDKDYQDLFIEDINKIYNYLSAKGVKSAMWGDHLLEMVRNKGFRVEEFADGTHYNVPGAISPERVRSSIPKDILIFNWMWGHIWGEKSDSAYTDLGFTQTAYGNMKPGIKNYKERAAKENMIGGAPSSWAAATEYNFGKDMLYEYLGSANMLWSEHLPTEKELTKTVQQMMPVVRKNFRGVNPPSLDNNPLVQFDISEFFNSNLSTEISRDFENLIDGEVSAASVKFSLPKSSDAILVRSDSTSTGENNRLNGIVIDKDVNSLIFLHASLKPGKNIKANKVRHAFPESADLIGWYEVIYEDGFVVTIPIRYGVHILEWTSRSAETKPGKYAYAADAVDCSNDENTPITFYAYEWRSPRFGKTIKKVNLVGVKEFDQKMWRKKGFAPDNGIILLSISASEKREVPSKLEIKVDND
ncbi:MAG: beta-N-acetylhexosaminidase [Melioribacteraceae bacterium]|nr:beta-N-acetylhexosaminidase [Melioribacteraceae bacterium]